MSPIKECLDKISYFNSRIKEETDKLYILIDIENKKQLLTSEQTNLLGGND